MKNPYEHTGRWVRGKKLSDESWNSFESWQLYCPNCKSEPFQVEEGGYILTDYCPNCGEYMGVTEDMRLAGEGKERKVKINFCPLCGRKMEVKHE